MLVKRKQVDDVVARLEHGPEAGVVGEIHEIEPVRRLDRAEDQPRRIEHRPRAVYGVDEGRTELGDLIGKYADVAARIENGLAGIVDLASEQVFEPLPPGPADACALGWAG
jgi:class 3 adenylate cyclase